MYLRHCKIKLNHCFVKLMVLPIATICISINAQTLSPPCSSINQKQDECCGNGVINPNEVCDVGIGKNGVDIIYQGSDLNGSVPGDGRPDYGCNATCDKVNDGWQCNGFVGDYDANKVAYDELYDYMIALYQDIKNFSQDPNNFNGTTRDCSKRSTDEFCIDYENKIQVFLSANRHQPISCATQNTLATPLMLRIKYRDGVIDAIKVNFEENC